ncbi:MAG: hypothetical protein AAGA20_02345 [Planctomycetota bacterium]
MALGSILVAAGLAGAHPMSNYAVRLELTPEATLLSIDFTYDDVVMLASIHPDEEGGFPPEALRTALAEFKARAAEGTSLFDADGIPLTLGDATVTGVTDPSRLEFKEVGDVGCTLLLRYPPVDRPRECSIAFDWGGWRNSISSFFYGHWSTADDEEGHVLWGERHRFPLLPPIDANTIRYEDERYALARPLKETRTGFSYLYVEADHVRHEFVLPLMTVAWQLAPYEPGLSAATMIGDEERALVQRQLDERLGTNSPLTIDGVPSTPSEEHVRWFTRDSLRRGVAADDGPISLATGFVGVMSIYPVTKPVRRIAFEGRGWADLLNDHVVSLIVGDTTERFILEARDPVMEWSGEPDLAAVPTPTDVAFGAPRRIGALGWAALAALVAALPVFARRRRAALLLLALSAGLGLLAVFVPTGDQEEGDGRSVLEALLQNTYRACGRQGERETLEMLAATSGGVLLEELYLELRGQLSGPWATGAGTRIRGVRMTDCEVLERKPRSITGLGTWLVDARIEHWGHVHDRSLEISGRLTAEASGGRWRFEDLVLLDKQIASADSRRRQ